MGGEVSPEGSVAPLAPLLVGIAICAVALAGSFFVGHAVGRSGLYAKVLDLRIAADSMSQQCRAWETR